MKKLICILALLFAFNVFAVVVPGSQEFQEWLENRIAQLEQQIAELTALIETLENMGAPDYVLAPLRARLAELQTEYDELILIGIID
jgi:uncharacterized coiled-coil protein SlyX